LEAHESDSDDEDGVANIDLDVDIAMAHITAAVFKLYLNIFISSYLIFNKFCYCNYLVRRKMLFKCIYP
jgi:hypothetical protein